MSEPIKLITPPTASDQNKADAVKILREDLRRAESGEVLGVIVITKDSDGMWSHHATGCASMREEIGAIENMKWDLLYRNRDQ